MRVIIIFMLGLFSQLLSAQEIYANPVDKKTHVADWKTYQPEGGVKAQEGRVINAGVRLLSTQAEFEKNITAEDLAKLIGFIQETLTKISKEYKDNGEILLQIEIGKQDKPKFKISFQGELSEAILQQFYESLKTIEYKTKESTVTFQVHLVVKKA